MEEALKMKAMILQPPRLFFRSRHVFHHKIHLTELSFSSSLCLFLRLSLCSLFTPYVALALHSHSDGLEYRNNRTICAVRERPSVPES